MGDVRGVIGQALEGRLQAIQHAVEGLGQFAHLRRCIAGGDALAELLGGQAPGGGRDPGQGREALARRQPAQQGGQGRRQGHPEPEAQPHLIQKMLVVADVQGHCRMHRQGNRQGQLEGPLAPDVAPSLAGPALSRHGGRTGQLGRFEGGEIRTEDHHPLVVAQQHADVVVSGQGIAQPLRQAVQAGLAVSAGHQLADHRELGGEVVLVQFVEVAIHRVAQQHPQRQQQHGGHQGEQQRQTGGEGQAATGAPEAKIAHCLMAHGASGASST